MPRGRPKTRTERDIKLGQLWNKLARSVYAVIDYDLYRHAYKPKLSDKEVRKLKSACSQAIQLAVKQHK